MCGVCVCVCVCDTVGVVCLHMYMGVVCTCFSVIVHLFVPVYMLACELNHMYSM